MGSLSMKLINIIWPTHQLYSTQGPTYHTYIIPSTLVTVASVGTHSAYLHRYG